MNEPPGLVIRPETTADHEEIAAVATRAFGSPAESRLIEAIRASDEYVAELALVAVIGRADSERVVGHVMVSRCRLVDGTHERTIVMLSPLAVDPDHQGRGIGGRLVRVVAALADERGEPLVVLEGDPRYYSRFGFEPAAGHGIELPLPKWAPVDAAQVLRLAGDEANLRGRVVYPTSFEVLDQAH